MATPMIFCKTGTTGTPGDFHGFEDYTIYTAERCVRVYVDRDSLQIRLWGEGDLIQYDHEDPDAKLVELCGLNLDEIRDQYESDSELEEPLSAPVLWNLFAGYPCRDSWNPVR